MCTATHKARCLYQGNADPPIGSHVILSAAAHGARGRWTDEPLWLLVFSHLSAHPLADRPVTECHTSSSLTLHSIDGLTFDA
jgi:hypothetical protein